MMVKLGMNTPDEFEFDSMEERWFFWWARDLLGVGIITKIIYQPSKFILSDKVLIEYEHQLKTKIN